jgi:arylsulfatase A-like enzyme
MRARHSAAIALLLAACGGGDEPPARQRLADLPGILRALAPAPAESLLDEEFERLPADWHVITGTQDVLAVAPDALQPSIGHEAGRSFLTLKGRGALYTVLPVTGGTPLLFRGELRARDVVPTAKAFHGAQFWVAESSRTGGPSELFGAGKRFDVMHPMPDAAGTSGWIARTLAFRTRPETRTLIVGCVLAVDEELTSGEVDFERVRVERVAERELWELQAAAAVAEAHRGDELPAAGDWRARRSVRAMLGGEERPAVLLLPGERLDLELELPEEAPELRTALAPWPKAHRLAPESLVFTVRVEDRELLREALPLGPLSETGWREVVLPLAEFAGRRVRLELGLDGPLPGLFGAPEVYATGRAPERWNVLFVSIDTLRADRVGAYGAAGGATPALDAMARAGLVLTDMNANAPYTLPAHATLFSGQFPSVHGVEDRDRGFSPARSPVLARILAERGWRTQAFAAGGFLTPVFGFAQGFDGFSIVDPLRHPGSRYFEEFRREYPEQSPADLQARPGLERVRGWLADHAAEPFFLFLHTYEVHDYDPPPGPLACAAQGCTSTLTDFRELLFPKQVEPFPGTPEDRAHLGHLYDAALRHVDAQLGVLFADLARLGIAERTLVVVTSDHGEELFEHGRLQHGKSLNEEILRIPLVLSVPGRAPARLETPAMQVDVAPTILSLLGIPRDERMQGVDLLGGRVPSRPIWAEVDDHFVRKTSLRADGWKLHFGPLDADVRIPNTQEWELFELARDPREATDRSQAERATLERLRKQLEGFRAYLASEAEGLRELEPLDLDEATRGLLEHLGYGGGEEEEAKEKPPAERKAE